MTRVGVDWLQHFSARKLGREKVSVPDTFLPTALVS